MSQWYGCNTFSNQRTKKIMKILFGENCKMLPKLYVPENLDHLVSVINLPTSIYFGSYVNIIEKMSIFTLYTTFICDDSLSEYEVFRKENTYKTIEHKFRIRLRSYYEGKPKIKFCKYCIQENEVKFLNREHQVQGNSICYKHNAILQYVSYNSAKSYSLNVDFYKLINESEYCIEKNDIYLDIRKQVSEVIHTIFTKSLEDSHIAIKAKLRKRLRELGYMKYNYFNHIEKFWNDFKPFNFINITEKQLYNLIYSTPNKEPPLTYILLILFLFQNLDYFIKYELIHEEIVNLEYSRDGYEHLYRSKFGERMIEEYNFYLKSQHGDKYDVISVQDEMLAIKHKLCGEIKLYPKNNYKWINTCKKCHDIEIRNKYKEKVSIIDSDYVFLDIETKKQLLKLKHLKCKKEFTINYYYFFNGQKCNYCKRLEQYKNRVNEIYGDEYQVIEYRSYLDNATYIHDVPYCRGKINYTPKQFNKLKYCPNCRVPKKYIANNKIIKP